MHWNQWEEWNNGRSNIKKTILCHYFILHSCFIGSQSATVSIIFFGSKQKVTKVDLILTDFSDEKTDKNKIKRCRFFQIPKIIGKMPLLLLRFPEPLERVPTKFEAKLVSNFRLWRNTFWMNRFYFKVQIKNLVLIHKSVCSMYGLSMIC